MIRLVRETSLLFKSEVPSLRRAEASWKSVDPKRSRGKPATLTEFCWRDPVARVRRSEVPIISDGGINSSGALGIGRLPTPMCLNFSPFGHVR